MSTTESSDKLEQFLIDLFQRHLRVEKINKEDSFFMLGGDSIMATQIANRLQDLCDSLPLDAVTIFEYPTVSELHQYLTENVKQEALVEFCQSL